MIQIEVSSACINSGKPTQMASCGIVLKYTDSYGRTAYREMGFPLGNTTKPKAELQAVRIGLASIKDKHRSALHVIHDGQYANDVLNRVIVAKKNTEIVDDLFKLIASYKDVRFTKVDSLDRAGDISKDVLNTHRQFDTGTILHVESGTGS